MKTETDPVPKTDPVPEPRATVVDDRLRYADRNRRRRRPGLPRRRTFEPLPLFSLASWSATDSLTLGLGVLLIVGVLVAVAMGIDWMIPPGAAVVMFTMITTQLRWGRMSRARRLAWHRARRAAEVGGAASPAARRLAATPLAAPVRMRPSQSPWITASSSPVSVE